MLHFCIREAAYYLWQNAGCPEGLDNHFWFEAENDLIEFSIESLAAINGRKVCCCFRCRRYHHFLIGDLGGPGFCINCMRRLRQADMYSAKKNGRVNNSQRIGVAMSPDSHHAYVRKVSERAYYLWQDADCPEGLDKHFWHLAVQQIEDENQVYSDWSIIEEEPVLETVM